MNQFKETINNLINYFGRGVTISEIRTELGISRGSIMNQLNSMMKRNEAYKINHLAKIEYQHPQHGKVISNKYLAFWHLR